jgi:hypothetical protein
MKDAGLLAEGDDPTPEQFAEHLGRLQDMVNVWQTKGIKLWLQLDQAITLTAGLATYTFGPAGTTVMTKPTRIIDDGYYLDANSNRRPIRLISRNEYNLLSNPTTQGPINSYWVDKQQTQLSVKFWLIPDTQAALGTAHLILQQQVTNPINLVETLNFPLEWFMALRWGLADEICTGQPSAIVQRCAQRALYYMTILEDWDVEDASTRFTPDQQSVSYYRTR